MTKFWRKHGDRADLDMIVSGFVKNCFIPIARNGKQEVVISPTHLLRKEVIHPHLPVQIPCYDLVLITNLTVEGPLQ